jgi:hypothetical protein
MPPTRPHRLLWVVPCVLAGGVAAQATRITPAGDPSVRSDSIYRLAVDPADHPDEDYIYLLDDGVVRFEADGRGTRTYRQVIQVFTREAAESWGEQSFSYVAGRERLTINWVRVLAPDGRVLSDKPVHQQESVAPVAETAPVFSDVKVRRVSLGGVAPNTLVDFSYTTETLKPIMPRDFNTGWRITTGRLTRRSRLIVDVPGTIEPRLQEIHLTFPRHTVERGGRRVYTWATADVPRLELEPFAGDSQGLGTFITASAPIGWGDVARWYAGLARDRYLVTPPLDSALHAVVAGAATLDDSLRAVHRWVAQDFRYVSLSLGVGGFQPRRPADVLATRYGDCKDKATLFITLAQRMGVRAYPVLVSSTAAVDSSMPSAQAFDHMIAAVAREDGYLYLDLTAELSPYGELPPAEQGGFGLLVRPDGTAEEVRLPKGSAAVNREEDLLVGELTPEGVLNGRLTEVAHGTRQYSLRSAFSDAYSDTERSSLARNIANGIVPGARGDSLEIFDGRDLRSTARLSLAILGGRAATPTSGGHVLTLPLRNYAAPGLVADLVARESRRFDIDAAAVFGPHEESWEMRLTLPEGWRAELPANVEAHSVFGTYRAEYAQEGRLLRLRRHIAGTEGIQPKEKIGELIEWLRAISSDDARFIVLRHGL